MRGRRVDRTIGAMPAGSSSAREPESPAHAQRREPSPLLEGRASERAADAWLTLAVFLATVAFQLPIRSRWLALLDEGYILAIADDVNRGQVLYRDVTIDAPFPLAFHLLALWQRLTEPSIAASRWLATILFGVYAAALFRVSRQVLPRGWALALASLVLCYRVWAFPHWQIYSYSMVAATLAVVATAIACRALATGSRTVLLLAGVVAGAAIMSKQDYGGSVALMLTVALAVLPWLERPRPASIGSWLARPFTFMLGGALVVLPYLAWFAWHGALDEMVEQTLVFPFSVMSSFDYPRLPDPWPLFGRDEELRAGIGNYFPSILATLWWNDCPGCWAGGLGRGGSLYQRTAFWDVTLKLVFWAPIAFAALAAPLWTGAALLEVRRRGGIGAEGRGRILVLALAVGFLLAFNPPRDWVHLMMVYPPSMVVGAALAVQATRLVPRAVATTLRAMLLAGTAALLVVTLALMSDLRRRVDHWLEHPRARVYADRLNGPLIEDVLAWIERNVPPGAPLPVYPTQPALNFLAARQTVAGYYVIWPMQAASRDARVLEEIERRGVDHILFSVSQWAHLRPFQDNAPELFGALVSGWEMGEVFSREANGPIVVALRRRGPRAPSTPLREVVAGQSLAWARWPFAEVLAQPAGTTQAPSPLRLALVVPRERPVLETAAGVNPDRWLGPPTGPVRFRVALERPDGTNEVLAERVLDPRSVVGDRRWEPLAVDLSRHAGEPVTLVLTVERDAGDPAVMAAEEREGFAGWREPRFVAAPGT